MTGWDILGHSGKVSADGEGDVKGEETRLSGDYGG